MAISLPVTDSGKKIIVRTPCIYYPIRFQEEQEQVRALLDSGSKVNAISSVYIEKLDIKTRKINVGAQKIDGFALETFGMVIVDFQVKDKGGRPRFLQETFLVTDTKYELVLGMLFLKISNANVSCGEETLT